MKSEYILFLRGTVEEEYDCGKMRVDVDFLKSMTIYDDYEETGTITQWNGSLLGQRDKKECILALTGIEADYLKKKISQN